MTTPQTKRMMSLLPQWMKMAKDESSVGAQFLDVFGMEFKDIETMMEEFQSSFYIGQASIDLIDIVYKVPVANENLFDLEGVLAIDFEMAGQRFRAEDAKTLRRFYQSFSEPMFLADADEGYVYIRVELDTIEDMEKPFEKVYVNGKAHYEYIIHHVWNPFDEFGMLLGVERLYKERNAAFKERILDVFRKPANATKEGLKNSIARGLGLDVEDVQVLDFQEKAFRGELFDDKGRPTRKMRAYAKRIREEMRMTWDDMEFGKAMWQSLENKKLGLKVLPRLWDGAEDWFSGEDFMSGVGDNDDLLVYKPKKENPVRHFQAKVGLKGLVESEELFFPEISFKYKIYAEGLVPNEDYPIETYRYTVKASQIVDLDFEVEAQMQYRYEVDIEFGTPSEWVFEGIAGTIDSRDVLHVPENKQVQVKVRLSTQDETQTPALETLTLRWEDTLGATNETVLDTMEDFTRNDAVIQTEMVDSFVTPTGEVELSFGNFYQVVDTKGSWEQAYDSGRIDKNMEITETGSLKLRLPKA